jgi:hypothetical protein
MGGGREFYHRKEAADKFISEVSFSSRPEILCALGIVIVELGNFTHNCRKYLDVGGRNWQAAGGNWIMRSFLTCTLHQIVLGG